MRRAIPVLVLAALAGCTEAHTLHARDVDLPPPGDMQIKAWSADPHRKDPRQVAHWEIQYRVDVPWQGELFNASNYEFIEKNDEYPEWGSYVVRSYYDRSNRHHRYRVKVRQQNGVWYAVQVSRFVDVEIPLVEGAHDH